MANFADVSFPNTTVEPVRLYDLSFFQERGNHEYAVIKFRDWNVPYDSVKQGTPITFILNGGLKPHEFKGYVHHIKVNVTPGVSWTEVHAIGSSYTLKQPSQKIYKKVTASEVVKKIAKAHGFAFNVADHPRVYDQLSQAGLSDMAFLKKLADKCGYSLRVQNAEIHFQPVTKVHDQMKSSAPVFTMRDQAHPGGSTLYSFTPLIGESLDQGGESKAATAISGVDRFTGKIIQFTNQKRPSSTRTRFEPEFFDGFSSTTVANEYQIAKSEATAVDERTRFPYRATAEVLGEPTLHPDMPVYINGVGPDYSGFWTILGTEHKVIQKNNSSYTYTTILHLGSDSLGVDSSNTKMPSGTPKRLIIPGVRQTNKRPITALKVGNRTVSKNQGSVGFGTVKNRSKDKVAKKTIVANKWVSTSGNLNNVTKRTSTSSAVIAQLRKKGVR